MDTKIIDSRFLLPCGENEGGQQAGPFTLVIFGGLGDLSRRKLMPALFHLFNEGALGKFNVLGFGRHETDDEGYRNEIKEALLEFGDGPLNEDIWDGFRRHLFFCSGSYEDDVAYGEIRRKIRGISGLDKEVAGNVIYYMAIPPQVTPVVIEKLGRQNLGREEPGTKVLVEKPFGSDCQSARALNGLLTKAFDENQIYRIDHYLGKDTVQNILFLRFSNAVFEHLWNCRYIDNVQITVSEDIGIGHRGSFYEQTGVIRDMVQNHVMQLIALIAMEPPVGFQADFIRDEKVKVFRSMRPMGIGDIDAYTVTGQYGRGRIGNRDIPGYREEEGVAPDSTVPTFFAGRFYVDNLRWAGVPFYVRTGKRLPRRVTEICIQLRQLPLRLFGRACDKMDPNILLLTIQPDERIALRFNVKYPHTSGEVHSVDMALSYNDTFRAKSHPAYERQLLDCIKGDLTLFVRQDSIETMWEIIDPLVSRRETADNGSLPNYAAGSWGPAEADRLLQQDGRCWITG